MAAGRERPVDAGGSQGPFKKTSGTFRGYPWVGGDRRGDSGYWLAGGRPGFQASPQRPTWDDPERSPDFPVDSQGLHSRLYVGQGG